MSSINMRTVRYHESQMTKREVSLIHIKNKFNLANDLPAFRDLEKVNKIVFRFRVGTDKALYSGLEILSLEKTKENLFKAQEVSDIIIGIYEEIKYG